MTEVTASPLRCFPGSSVVKNLPANAGDAGMIPGQEDPLEKEMQHFIIFPGKSQRQRTMEGYSPWGHKRVGQDLATEDSEINQNL